MVSRIRTTGGLLLLLASLLLPQTTFAQTTGCLCTVTGTSFPATGWSGTEIASHASDIQLREAQVTCEGLAPGSRFNGSNLSCTIPTACTPAFTRTLNDHLTGQPVTASCIASAVSATTPAPATTPATGTTPATTPPPATEAAAAPSATDEAIDTDTPENAVIPFQPIKPNPSVPIPGVVFSDARQDANGTIEIPYLAEYIGGVYRLSVGLGAILAAIMIVFGGFKYMLAASLPEVKDGKTIIQDAVVGLVVLLSSFVILKTINPKLVEVAPIRIQRIQSTPPSEDSIYDSISLDADPNAGSGAATGGSAANGQGPARYCRQTLAANPRPNNATVWCAACGTQVSCGTRVIGGPDPACPALIGSCGGSYGKFLASVTGNCSGKTFRSLEGLDGGTYGILGYMQQNLPQLLQLLQRKDAAVYNRVMTAGNNRDTSANALCASNQSDRGFICNQDYRHMLETALPTRAFALAQLEDSYRKYEQRVRAAISHGFRSSYGQAMWATAANNPGRCGPEFGIVLDACRSLSGASESERIDCFLQKFVELGCRGGVPGATRRADSIRQELRGVSRTDSVAPPTLAELEACIPSY